MIGIDTNLLVRHLVQDDEGQACAARDFFRQECSAVSPGWINRIVLCELTWVLERAYRYSRAEVAAALEALAETAEFRLEDSVVVWSALRSYREGIADFADALVAATNRQRGCETTVTLDRKASRLGDMRLLSSTSQGTAC
jgi:predicted nucleic-acid-binding protein